MESRSIRATTGPKQGTTYKLNLEYPEVEMKLSTINQFPLKSISLDISTWTTPTEDTKRLSKELWYKIKKVVKDKLDTRNFSKNYIEINQCPFDMNTGNASYLRFEFTFYNKVQLPDKNQVINSFIPVIEGIYENCFSDNSLYRKKR